MIVPHRARTVLGTLCACLALIALSACSSGDSDTGPNPEPAHDEPSTVSAPASTPAESPSSESPSASAADNQGLLAAGQKAEQTVSGSTLISIEAEHNDTQWEVEVVTSDGTEHKVYLSSDGSKIIKGPVEEKDDAADKAKHRKRVKAAKLDYRQAVDAITQAVPGRVTELNLDSEQGTTVWEADVIDGSGTKHEVSIDAASGKVIEQN